MRCHVFIEGKADSRLIERTLAGRYSADHVRVREVGSRSSLASAGRTILATRQEPVVVLLNSDSVSERGAEERREGMEEMLGQFGSSRMFRVLFFEPEMETVFFHDPKLVATLTGGQPLFTEDRVRAEYEPKKVLAKLLGVQGRDLTEKIEELTERVDLAVVRALPAVVALEEFLGAWQAQAA